MTPEEKKQFEELQARVLELEGIIGKQNYTKSQITFIKKILCKNGFSFSGDLPTDTIVGMKIGTGATQKLGFFGKTPVVQQTRPSSPSGGGTIDTQARTVIINILDLLTALGLTN